MHLFFRGFTDLQADSSPADSKPSASTICCRDAVLLQPHAISCVSRAGCQHLCALGARLQWLGSREALQPQPALRRRWQQPCPSGKQLLPRAAPAGYTDASLMPVPCNQSAQVKCASNVICPALRAAQPCVRCCRLHSRSPAACKCCILMNIW
jgi:hypothetical protein